MNIEHYISQLLYRYQCVTVPGFGAFLTETVSASVNETNHNFFPPKKVVSFNSHIKNNDGLLANHIAQAEKLSYDEVVSKMESEVTLWKNKLQNRDFLIFKNIGLLKLNSENNIVFEGYNHTNYLAESFGLASFVSPNVKREVLKTLVTEESEKIAIDTEVITLETRRSNPFVTFVKYAAVITVSLGATAFGYVGYIDQQEQAETLLVQAQVQKEVQSKLQEATFFIANPVNDAVANPELNYDFHIVSGSFRRIKNANKSLQELNQKGFNSSVITREDGLFSVVYGTYTSQAEADAALLKIQTQENKEAWILLLEKK
ncbi:SPOR domain-containing protein [Flavobacterium amnicola]|uniref:SPOR domain-containing protein n=1 Tax=Flavobacterium amnicola TaxID=2506422 RepID=A0A4Q1K5W1_9FLAO|nr:SPOR domain-containing protein [Flavobacterium amnicola]RXR20900.1 SPOR domain-containing protein [Flavobacterium amnicola]